MDNISSFIENLEEAIEGTEPGSFTESTAFKELANWDSIAALMTIAMIYCNYSVQITGDELMGCTVVSDLFNLTSAKRNAA